MTKRSSDFEPGSHDLWRAHRIITQAEADLGGLSCGQRIDLLADQIPTMKLEEVRALLAAYTRQYEDLTS